MVLTFKKQFVEFTHQEEVFVIELEPSIMPLLKSQFTRLVEHAYIIADDEANSEEFHQFLRDMLEGMDKWGIQNAKYFPPMAPEPVPAPAEEVAKANPFHVD